MERDHDLMTAEPITSASKITPRWLTATLVENGHLTRGKVTAISKTRFTTTFSNIFRLALNYSSNAFPNLPSNMLLKAALPGSEDSLNMGKLEVSCYRAFEHAMADGPLVRYFDAVHSPRSNRSHILMEDLSPTHFQPEIPIPPSRPHCELSVKALAQFHVFGWRHAALGSAIGELLDAARVDDIVGQVQSGLTGMADELGDALSTHRRAVYDRALPFMAEFWARRLTATHHNTLIHGDAHLWNVLHPKDLASGRAYLIDLGTCNRIRPPTNDLAYMMALQWYPERRALMELSLLERYHEHLVSLGVKDYTWDECWLDYRFSVVSHLFTPVFQWAGKRVPASVWWHNLDRIFQAYDDLRCAEII
jgi:hypothetical protein